MSPRLSCAHKWRFLPSLECLGTRELLSGALPALALNGLSPPALLPALVSRVAQVDVLPNTAPAPAGPAGPVAQAVALVLQRTAPLLDLPVVVAVPPVLSPPPGPGPVSPPVPPPSVSVPLPPVKVDVGGAAGALTNGAPVPASVSGPLDMVSALVPGSPDVGAVPPVLPLPSGPRTAQPPAAPTPAVVSPVGAPSPPANVAPGPRAALPAATPDDLLGVAPALPMPVSPPNAHLLPALPSPQPSVDTRLLPGGTGAGGEAPDVVPQPVPSLPAPDEKVPPTDGVAEAEAAPPGAPADFLLPSFETVAEVLGHLPALPPQGERALYWLALALAAAALAVAVGQRGRSQPRPGLPGDLVARPLV
jgi:hypothetical protein